MGVPARNAAAPSVSPKRARVPAATRIGTSGRKTGAARNAFDLLDKIPGTKRGPGGVICLYDRLITLKGNDRVIPINYL